jgi:hypothetical protein
MTTTAHPPRPSRPKAPVLRLIPTITKPLNTNCAVVTVKLKRALTTAQSGATVGALVIALDEQGHWTADLAGQLRHDGETLCQIACRLLGACLTSQ